ncbi:helix-turn-helix transcriptional regulator [Coraliomargarita parva]|uniref:helix-turn-helix transcriptional regulator n=1 Tax=Coraliomargarita parva TaxID=3014050 RepID=UPI0022B37715|nr:AraC family transcriptional regulator [Coraliomargarita parva]
MNPPAQPVSGFPETLAEPTSYYRGIEAPERPRVNNLVTFLRNNRESLQQKNFYNRSHHRNVLILVLETAGSVIVDGAEHPLKPGQAYLVRPFQFHHYLNLESDQLRWLFLTFDLVHGSELLDYLSHSILQPQEADLQIWRDIVRCANSENANEQQEALPLLDTLLYRLAKSHQDNPSNKPRDSWIAKVEGAIVESVHQGWTVDEIGRKLGLSGRQLRTRFQNEMGISIRDYRANYQLNRAINLLRDSQNSMNTIAELCGFNSQAVFNRFIKRETGFSPLSLRKRL